MNFKRVRFDELSESELQTINTLRKREFNSSFDITSDIIEKYGIVDFCLLYNDQGLAAFCLLLPIKVSIADKSFDIVGLAAVVSVNKGQGYGQALMVKVIEAVEYSDKTIIGFCNHNNYEFYRKCGFTMRENEVSRFIFKDEKGNELHDETGGDVIFYPNTDGCYDYYVAKPEASVFHPVPHW
jgi:predicted GNAT family N-acyltransferase